MNFCRFYSLFRTLYFIFQFVFLQLFYSKTGGFTITIFIDRDAVGLNVEPENKQKEGVEDIYIGAAVIPLLNKRGQGSLLRRWPGLMEPSPSGSHTSNGILGLDISSFSMQYLAAISCCDILQRYLLNEQQTLTIYYY